MLAPLFLLAAAAPPPAAPLKLPPDVAVFSGPLDPGAQDAAGRAELEMVRALKRKTVPLADVEAAFPAPPPASDAEGLKLFAEGKQAYDNLDTDGAAKSLTNAAVWFIKHPEAATPEKLSDIFIFLGAAELANGAKKEAQKELARALEMNPAATLDPKYFGVDVQKVFDKAKDDIANRRKGTMKITSNPSGAEVTVAGESRGLTPIDALDLPAGRYVVTFTRPGFARTAAFPEVKEDKEIDVSQKLTTSDGYQALRDKAAGLINKPTLDASTRLPLAAEDLGKALKARYLVMVAVATGAAGVGCTAYVWDLNTGNRLNDVGFTLDADGESAVKAADQIRAWIEAQSAVVVAPPPPAEKPSAGGPVYKQWWFWTAVGAVAVAGGVTAGVVAAQPHDQGFNVLLARP